MCPMRLGPWSNARAKRHARGSHACEPFQLRVSAYRVLPSPGREFATKATGGIRLELADLVVSPVGRWVTGTPIRLGTDVVFGKLRTGPGGS
jgi:hypothetical protein